MRKAPWKLSSWSIGSLYKVLFGESHTVVVITEAMSWLPLQLSLWLFGCCGLPPICSSTVSILALTLQNHSKPPGFCHPQNSKWPIARHHVDPHGTRLRTLETRWFVSSRWTGFFGTTMSCQFHSSSLVVKRTWWKKSCTACCTILNPMASYGNGIIPYIIYPHIQLVQDCFHQQ